MFISLSVTADSWGTFSDNSDQLILSWITCTYFNDIYHNVNVHSYYITQQFKGSSSKPAYLWMNPISQAVVVCETASAMWQKQIKELFIYFPKGIFSVLPGVCK